MPKKFVIEVYNWVNVNLNRASPNAENVETQINQMAEDGYEPVAMNFYTCNNMGSTAGIFVGVLYKHKDETTKQEK